MGFARFCFKKTHTLLGTPEYMAPEIITYPHVHNWMVDWWALGILTFEPFTGESPWHVNQDTDDVEDLILAYRDCMDQGIPEKFHPWRVLDGTAKDFVSRLLTVDPKKRLGAKRGAEDVKQHGWFKFVKFNFEKLYSGELKAPY